MIEDNECCPDTRYTVQGVCLVMLTITICTLYYLCVIMTREDNRHIEAMKQLQLDSLSIPYENNIGGFIYHDTISDSIGTITDSIRIHLK